MPRVSLVRRVLAMTTKKISEQEFRVLRDHMKEAAKHLELRNHDEWVDQILFDPNQPEMRKEIVDNHAIKKYILNISIEALLAGGLSAENVKEISEDLKDFEYCADKFEQATSDLKVRAFAFGAIETAFMLGLFIGSNGGEKSAKAMVKKFRVKGGKVTGNMQAADAGKRWHKSFHEFCARKLSAEPQLKRADAIAEFRREFSKSSASTLPDNTKFYSKIREWNSEPNSDKHLNFM